MTRSRAFLLLSVAAVSLATGACRHLTDDPCAGQRPSRLSQQTIAAMTDEEVASTLANNETGRRNCGWRPNR